MSALAGAIPTPATPALEALALGLKVAAGAATGIQLGADLIYGVQSGNYSAFRSDGLSAAAGLITYGKGASALHAIDAAVGNAALGLTQKKILERAVDIGYRRTGWIE